jgi:hypothetical protein
MEQILILRPRCIVYSVYIFVDMFMLFKQPILFLTLKKLFRPFMKANFKKNSYPLDHWRFTKRITLKIRPMVTAPKSAQMPSVVQESVLMVAQNIFANFLGPT